jgi:hypothetical protein
VVYGFQRPPVGDREVGTVVLVTRLRGTLGRERLNPENVAAGNPQVSVETGKWKSFDVEGFRVPEQAGEVKMVTFNVQVPLAPEAVQLAVFGDSRDEGELRGILRGLLGNLEGETNWLTEKQRSERFASGISRLIVCSGVAVAALGAVVLFVVRMLMKTSAARRSPPRRRSRRETDELEDDDRGDRPRRRRRRDDDDDREERPRSRED